MSTLVSILVCLAIAGHVQSYPHHKTGLTMADIQTVETALIMRFLQDEMAHIQGIVDCSCTMHKHGFT